jgi:hypothetical protein
MCPDNTPRHFCSARLPLHKRIALFDREFPGGDGRSVAEQPVPDSLMGGLYAFCVSAVNLIIGRPKE